MLVAKHICDQLTDEEIVRRAHAQPDYFSCLYQRYEQLLLRYIRRLTGAGVETAEDILQDAFINVWRNLNAYDDDLKLSSWLYRITHNQAVSWKRKQSSRGKELSWQEEWGDAVAEEIVAEVSDGQFDRLQIEAVLQRLSLNYKEILVLRFLENFSYEEISDILKIPEGTVATRVNRAKKAFAKATKQAGINFYFK